jgi:hypothetical protein
MARLLDDNRTWVALRSNEARTWSRNYAFPAVFCLSFALFLLFRLYVHAPRTGANPGTVFNAAARPQSPALRVTSLVQHGDIIEICGSTEPGAVVMINGQTVPTIFDENSFRYFLGPLSSGTTIVSVTAQNQEGGVNTKQLAVTIE